MPGSSLSGLPVLAARLRRAVPRPAGLTLAVALGAAGLAAALPAGPALAGSAALPSGCTLSGTTVTCTYTAQGETQFVVPPGVSSITATVVGAQGGSSYALSNPGGLGAQAAGSFAVTPGQTLYLEVDVLGGPGGEFSTGFTDGGAGGGESDVRTCPASGTCPSGSTLGSRLLVAGGGGGGGETHGGGHGGNAGTTGAAGNGENGAGGYENAGGGTGATGSAPGTGGAGCGGGSAGGGGASAGGAGGAGGNTNRDSGEGGGGGGAGWFGGGGGGGCGSNTDDAAGGGGGSSYAAASVPGATFSQAVSGQAPSVTLSYTPAPLSVTTTGLPGGQVGSAYGPVTLAAAGGVMPYSWSVTQGVLPPGLSLDASTGVISGTPSAYGTFDFTVTVADAEIPAMTAGRALSITVKPAPLVITTTSLPAATGGSAYTATLAAAGGVTPYTWSVTAGSLPPGLTLDASTGVISGTPDVAGTYSFTVTVKDSESPAMTVSRALSISVSGPVITSLRPDSGPTYGDTPVIVTGTGLSCPAGDRSCRVTVTFGGHPGVVVLARATEIEVVSPAGSGTVTVTVTVGGVPSQATAAGRFSYVSPLFLFGRFLP